MYDIAAVGILVADVIVKPVDSYPMGGELQSVDSIEMFSGGNAMTAAVNFLKLGVRPALIGKVGNDIFGDFLIKCLKENNVSAEGVKRSDNAQTSVSAVISSSSGERSFLHCRGANAVFDISDIDYDIIKNSKMVFITGTFVLDNFDGEQTVEFLKECKRLGKTTALDVCWNQNAQYEWLLKDAMKYIDIFMPSIDEAKMITGEDDLEKISDCFIEHGAGCVVIKCGSKGCYIKDSKTMKSCMVDALKGIKAVDTTGAGDSFCSGFLAAYSKGYDIYDCARIGNAVGACCVMQKGATSGTRSFEDTLKMLD